MLYNKAIKLADKNIHEAVIARHEAISQNNKQFRSLKATSLRYIGIVHYKQGSYDKAIKYYSKALKIFEEFGDKKEMANCYGNMGVVHMYRGSYDKAIEYYAKALKIYEEFDDKKEMANCYGNIGIVHMYQGSYDKAIEYYLKQLKLVEELIDKKGMSNCYGNIRFVHFAQSSFDKAIEYYLKALKINEKLGDKTGMANCYNNIGLVYKNQGNHDKAIEYYFKSLKIKEELGDKKGISNCYINIGIVHYDYGSYAQAIEYYLKSLKITEELGDKNGIVLCYINIGSLNITLADSASLSVNQRLNYLNKAIEYGIKAIELAKEIKTMPRENEASNILMNAYKKLGNFKKSIEYAEIFITTNDSMFSEEKTKALAKMQAQYEAEKRELTIQKLEKEKLLQNETIARKNAESKKQRILIFSFLVGFIIILVFSVFLYRLFLQKKKANVIVADKNQSLEIAFAEISTQKEEITVQRDEIQSQRDKLSEQNIILAEQKKEITDSINYAKRIQQAVLPDLANLTGLKLETFVLFKPKDIVSGDFSWTTKVNEWLIVTVADYTGHGVPGAFMSMLGVSFLNEIVRKKEVTKASDILDHLRESIIEALQQKGQSGEQKDMPWLASAVKDGMDIALCAINTMDNTLQFAGANNPLFIVSTLKELKELEPDLSTETIIKNYKKQLIEVKADKQPVAIFEKMEPFTNHVINLQKGDTLYLCSDGYEDQFGGPNNKKFKIKQLKEIFMNIVVQPMNEQRDILETTFDNWKGEHEQIDDVTILGIKI
ncbi:MAG: tetratricopeptide repeat protein [Bacteroidia bacterium]|nr:tetratricopeptide repeat protein [Bacteroidia bacterium]